jgi:hypothetical protein
LYGALFYVLGRGAQCCLTAHRLQRPRAPVQSAHQYKEYAGRIRKESSIDEMMTARW